MPGLSERKQPKTQTQPKAPRGSFSLPQNCFLLEQSEKPEGTPGLLCYLWSSANALGGEEKAHRCSQGAQGSLSPAFSSAFQPPGISISLAGQGMAAANLPLCSEQSDTYFISFLSYFPGFSCFSSSAWQERSILLWLGR